jgi:hypothetical protein
LSIGHAWRPLYQTSHSRRTVSRCALIAGETRSRLKRF